MDFNQAIERLDAEWDMDGFLGLLRDGEFIPDRAESFLALLNEIVISDEDLLPKRLVSLLWYLPSFLVWQEERVAVKGDVAAYKRFINQVCNRLEDLLGVP